MKSSIPLALVLLAACGGPLSPELPDAGPSLDAGVALDAGLHPADGGTIELGWTEISATLARSCRPCHAAGNRHGRVVVEDYDAVVGVASALGLSHVEPGFPEDSYLLHKVRPAPETICRDRGVDLRLCGALMPPSPRAPMDPGFVESLEAWIERGAPAD